MWISIGGESHLVEEEYILGESDAEGDGHGFVGGPNFGFLGLILVFLLHILL